MLNVDLNLGHIFHIFMVASNEAYHHSSLHSLLLFFRGEGGYGYKNEVRRTKSYGDMSESVRRREKGCECESFEML